MATYIAPLGTASSIGSPMGLVCRGLGQKAHGMRYGRWINLVRKQDLEVAQSANRTSGGPATARQPFDVTLVRTAKNVLAMCEVCGVRTCRVHWKNGEDR